VTHVATKLVKNGNMNEVDFSIPSLAGELPITTLAYFISLTNDLSEQLDDKESINDYFISKYYIDENAVHPHELLEYQGLTPNAFRPITPVLLTNQFSPIQSVVSMGSGCAYFRINVTHCLALAVFDFSSLERYKNTLIGAPQPDELFFLSIINKIINRKYARNSTGVLIVQKVGWSYNSELQTDSIDDEAKQVMKSAGFLATSRIFKYQ